MPELPDLEVYTKNLNKLISKKEIKKIGIFQNSLIDISKEDFIQKLTEQKIDKIYRIGKEINILTNVGDIFSIHLMLHGGFFFTNKIQANRLPNKILYLEFNENHVLTIADPDSLTKIRYNPQISEIPDALSTEFTEEYLYTAIEKSKKKQIKNFLTDQKIIKGIGNAYADEILYDANLSPYCITGKIPKEDVKKLYHSIKTVLLNAIVQIENIQPNILTGEVRSFLKIHNKNLDYTEKNELILTQIHSGKRTNYTQTQTLYI